MTTSPVLRPAPARSRLRPIGSVAGALALLAGILLIWPPTSSMSDLRVYFAAARGFVDGQNIYEVHHQYPGMLLGFTYPPFAAIVLAPLAVGQEFAKLLLTLVSGISLLAIGSMIARALRPQWSKDRLMLAGLVCAAAGLLLEPVSATFGMGQVNLLLMALLMADLLGHTPRRFRGVLVGVATGIKLTPGIFIVFLLVTRRFREAAIASATTAATILLGYLVMPGPTVAFWTRCIFDPTRPGPAQYISNQSLRGAITRITRNSDLTGLLWLLAAAVTAVAGLAVAKRLHGLGRPLDALVVTGFAGLLVSPISWSNHWVWALPATAVVWSWATSAYRLGNGGRVFAAAWTVVFALGLPWMAPWADDKEYHHTFLQALVGNSYTLAGIVLLAVAWFTTAKPPVVR
jgi:alpha-1,2-mannosyltransferase